MSENCILDSVRFGVPLPKQIQFLVLQIDDAQLVQIELRLYETDCRKGISELALKLVDVRHSIGMCRRGFLLENRILNHLLRYLNNLRALL